MDRLPRLSDENIIDGLQCPCCRAPNLHSTYVVTYDRVEDGETTETHIEDGKVTQGPSDARRNPSARRHGVAVGFWCEQCPNEPELTIAQHKGATFLEWRDKTLPAEEMFSRAPSHE
jgi:hypothetical protein